MNNNEENESVINKKIIKKEKFENNNICHIDIETVILLLIDKIIVNVIHEADNKIIYNNLDIHCYKYIKNNINNLLKTKFFCYENGKEEKKGNIFLNYNHNKFDEWVKIEEPLTPDKDRNNSNMIKICNYKESKNKINEIIELENNNYQNRENFGKKSLRIKKLFNKVKIINNLIKGNKRKKTKYIKKIFNLDYIDLEKEKYFNIFSEMNKSEEYNILRKEKEEQIIKKEKEEKIQKEKRLLIERRLKIIESNKNKKLPYINGKELTFDSNGNILSKNLLSISKLKKEFIPLKYKLSDNGMHNIIQEKSRKSNINGNLSKLVKKEEISKYNIPNKNIDENIILNSDINSNNEIKKEEIKYKKVNINKLKENKKKIGNVTKRNKNLKIEYNPKDKREIHDFEMKYKKRNENKAITPSGSNLEDIIPSTGVVVKYEHFKREGGFDYFRKYNKPSMNDFNKLALSYSPDEIQEKLLFPENCNFNSYDKDEKKKLLYNGYIENFDEKNNPLIKNAYKLYPNNNSTSNSSIQILKKVLNLKNNKKILLSDDLNKKLNLDRNNNSNSLNIQNSIQLSNSVNYNNLYNIFNEIKNKDYPNLKNNNDVRNNKDIYNYQNSSNKKFTINKILDYKNNKFPIIKKFESEKNKIYETNELKDSMIKFNYNIIKDIKKNYWGKKSINEISENDLSLNLSRRPLLLSPKKISSNNLEKYRERKNLSNKNNDNEKIKYEKIIVSKMHK